MKIKIKSGDFVLGMEVLQDVCDDGLTGMKVLVADEDFLFSTYMNVYAEDAARFFNGLNKLYGSLSDTVSVKEPYGSQMYLCFKGDGRGHILTTGCLHRVNDAGDITTVEFIKNLDQTSLAEVARYRNID